MLYAGAAHLSPRKAADTVPTRPPKGVQLQLRLSALWKSWIYESRQRSKPTLLPCIQYLEYFVYSKLMYPSSAALCHVDVPKGQKSWPTGESGRWSQCCCPSPAETPLDCVGNVRSLLTEGLSLDQAQGNAEFVSQNCLKDLVFVWQDEVRRGARFSVNAPREGKSPWS